MGEVKVDAINMLVKTNQVETFDQDDHMSADRSLELGMNFMNL
jgi:hypothetical protein